MPVSHHTTGLRKYLPLGLLIAIALTLVAVPGVAAAAPALEVELSHSPATFHRGETSEFPEIIGDSVTVVITNSGDTTFGADSGKPVTVTDNLGAPLTVPLENGLAANGLDCNNPAGISSFTCEQISGAMGPGESLSLRVPVNVPVNAPDTVTNSVTVSATGVPPITVSESIPVVDRTPFEVEGFSAGNIDEHGNPDASAGDHPYENVTRFFISRSDSGYGSEWLKDAYVTLPPGFFGNPAAAPRCPISDIPGAEFLPGYNCPRGSRVGFVHIENTELSPDGSSPLYNVKPDRGHPAQFAFNYSSAIITITPTLLPRSKGYALMVGAPNIARLAFGNGTVNGAAVHFFGVPYRQNVEFSGAHYGSEAPFLSNPVDCSSDGGTWHIDAASWGAPGLFTPNGLSTFVPDINDPNWKTREVPGQKPTGCEELSELFKAGASVAPTQGGSKLEADQPAGLAVGLDFPQTNDPTDTTETTFDPSTPQTPELKDITMKLPAGLAISSSSATGLVGCSDSADDPAGDQVRYDSIEPAACPDASKIGTASATTPLLALRDPVTDEVVGPQPLGGSVYLLKPHPGDLVNGQDGKFRLLIELSSPRYGIDIKLPGVVVADKQTGQLTATFQQNPQLPAKHVQVDLKSGPRAPLATPTSCGGFTTDANFIPWGSPEVQDVNDSSTFTVGSGPGGKPCVSSPAQRPFSPSLSAGAENAKAGAASPFTIKITREDGDQELSSLNITTPPGFSAKLAGVGTCSDAAIAVAAAKSGSEEQANPSCPAASKVGTVTAGAGPGSTPFYTTGNAYLAGPYKGAPLSFAFITPAVAGPFDLGNVVVRAAVYLNSATAQVTVKTDPLPQILDGVPLRLRSIAAHLDRADFTVNPTDCEPMTVSATIGGSDGASASPSQAFQVGSCASLGFQPKLQLAFKGKVRRRSHPSLRATLTARPGDANIAAAQVKLPKAAFLDNAHIRDVCTRVQFAAHQCPPGSIYGKATATTPLLGYPLSGPVYLRSSSHELPDLVVAFQGPAFQPIEIELAGKTDSVKGALRNTFEAVPDVPVSKFQLELFGGKKGLVIMSNGFCSHPQASVKFTAQNGLVSTTTPKVAAKCPKAKKGHRKGKGKGKH